MPTLCKAATAFSLTLLTMSDTELSAANYDEGKVPQFSLPDPLKMQDGTPVKSAKDWTEKRRPEVISLFREHVYGHAPERPEGLKFKVTQNDDTALAGKAIRREVLITFARKEETPEAHLLIYIPKNIDGPAPTFLVINFDGNHLIHPDPAISISRAWVRNTRRHGITDNKPKESNRGNTKSIAGGNLDMGYSDKQGDNALEQILSRGYALATIYYGDIDPDYDDGFENGVHRLYPKPKPLCYSCQLRIQFQPSIPYL